MSGILGSWSSAACNHHNALRNVSEYACGVTFTYKKSVAADFRIPYAVVSLQECCAKVNAPVLRIPGNTGCEMQFCQVPDEAVTSTITAHEAPVTLSGTVVSSPAPRVTTKVSSGPQRRVENCMYFVDKSDVPDDVAAGISDAGNWCVVRMYDTDIHSDVAAVTASAAPASWTSAAADPLDKLLASQSATRTASAQATATSSNGGARNHEPQRAIGSVGSLLAALLIAGGLVVVF